MKVDLLLRNGRVVDPANGVDGVMDVAVLERKIYRVGDCSDLEVAWQVDASSCLVTPGLVDSHMHLYRGGGFGGVSADLSLIPNGATCGIDAGSAGTMNYRMFSEGIVHRELSAVKALLNVSPAGLSMNHYYVEHMDPQYFELAEIQRVLEEFRDEIVGLKCRISQNIVREFGLSPLKKAVEIGDEVGLPVVIHATNPPEDVDRVLELLRPGDVFGHAFHSIGYGILNEQGRIKDCVWKARERGVIFDVANGGEHFAWKTCWAAAKEGFWPDTISTDMFRNGLYNPNNVHSLPFVMSKYLTVGMKPEEIIRAVTLRPAQVFGLPCGTLTPGAAADLSVLRLEEGHAVRFPDKAGDCQEGSQLFRAMMTVRNGSILYRQVDF